MAITATPTNLSTTHRDGIRAAGQVYSATLAVSGASEVGSLNVDGATVLEGALTFGGKSTIPPGRVFRGTAAAASVATAGAGTITAANIVTGTVVRDCAGSSRTDTLPTAALLVAALTAAFGVAVAAGDCVDFLYVNGSDPVTEIITVAEGSGGTWDANQTAVSRTILGTCSKLVRLRVTDIGSGTEAYVIYA